LIVTVQPSVISGSIHAAASKSSMQRACALALITGGETIISNPGHSNDDVAAIGVIQKLGATVKYMEDKLLVSSKGILPVAPEINCGESGLGLRMFGPVAALSSQEITLNGSGSLLQRPMNFFDEIFPRLNVHTQSDNGKLPVKIKGPLQPADITIDGSLSSQFLTGLLLAYAKACTKPVTITVKDLKSKPYIDLTLQVMKHFGWNVENYDYKEFHFNPGVIRIFPVGGGPGGAVKYTVEGDWSGGAFLLVAGAIAGNITVEGLDVNSPQADKAILDALKMAGTKITIDNYAIKIKPGSLAAFQFDATDCPDLFPPLVALAANCTGVTSIRGVHRLTYKESDRATALHAEFKKMGVMIEFEGDDMLITGNGNVNGNIVHSHHDHRIAMACAVAGLKAQGKMVIHDAEAVNKSYPGFYDHLQKLNARISIS
jgi:3-phosphoshikimate 1-carboxyvinyltransferase